MRFRVWLIMLVVMVLVACAEREPEPTVTPQVEIPDDNAGLPNPASVYCEEQGYELEMREEEGGTYGVCRFPDGSECDEWAYFRGECQPGDSLATPVVVLPVAVTQAEDGCQLPENKARGYQFHFPADATIVLGDVPLQSLGVLGPLLGDDH